VVEVQWVARMGLAGEVKAGTGPSGNLRNGIEFDFDEDESISFSEHSIFGPQIIARAKGMNYFTPGG